MPETVYIETTIVSYLTAWPSRDIVRLSHEIVTRQWWQRSRARFELFTSIFTHDEAAAGDPAAADERMRVLQGIPLLAVTPDVAVLAGQLASALQLPERARMDAAHVAVCAVHGVQFLLTWNCRHLANGALTDKIEETCEGAGYAAPRILTPELLMELP